VVLTWPDADKLHRTAKQLVDSGRAATQSEAENLLGRFVLQLDIPAGIGRSPSMQAALLTAINAGHRAFLGGVVARVVDDPVLTEGWAAGMLLSKAVVKWGGRLTATLHGERPTIVFGHPTSATIGDIVIRAAVSGWAGGVIEPTTSMSDDGITPAGVLAGALAVSECFQHCLGDPQAGRRDVGVSLWRPDSVWGDSNAGPPQLSYLPSSLWLLGLGHLGQAYAWSLGLLPYATASAVSTWLLDTDQVVKGNLATGLLARTRHIGQSKARVVARQLEGLGVRTRIVERRFDDLMRPSGDEPLVALAGFDDAAPRRLLGGDRFQKVIDVGLGAGPVAYLDILLHSFPSELNPAEAFPRVPPMERLLPVAYRTEIDRRIAQGEEEGQAACGVAEIAGISVGAAFVGAIAGALAVGDVLRYLHDGRAYSVISLDLRSPSHIQAVSNRQPGPYQNIGFTRAR
jgi:hypothetical protein